MKRFNFLQRVVTVPRGQNVGTTIIEDLRKNNLLNRIDIKTINPQRDLVNKAIVVTLEYTLHTLNTIS